MILSAQNHGQRRVALDVPSYMLPTGRRFSANNPFDTLKFPHHLPPGEACRFWVPIRDFARILIGEGYRGKVSLVGCYSDQLGHEYRSKPFEFDVDAWGDEMAS
jgi:hypothetical protein